MSTEQGDVAVIREALTSYPRDVPVGVVAALDRLVAALERAEREPKNSVEWMLVVKDERDRALKAERALGEAERMFAAAVYAMPNSEITVWPVHMEVDLTLERYDDPVNKCARFVAALRPSEEASDES